MHFQIAILWAVPFFLASLLPVTSATENIQSLDSVRFINDPVTPDLPNVFGRQLLVSISEDWTSFHATLYGFSRPDDNTPWKLSFTHRAVLGSNGLGWGLGVHGWILSDGPVKHEGDKRSPAGLFRLPSAFGYASPSESKIIGYPYLQLGKDTMAVDDPSSPFYNQIVDSSRQNPNQWKSAEVMFRPDGAYRLGVFVAHNDPRYNKTSKRKELQDDGLPVPGKQALGSCIFLHIWRSAENPTIGCTALAPADMERLVQWLREEDSPLLLQLPLSEYRRLQKSWNLPSLPGN